MIDSNCGNLRVYLLVSAYANTRIESTRTPPPQGVEGVVSHGRARAHGGDHRDFGARPHERVPQHLRQGGNMIRMDTHKMMARIN